MCNWILTEPPDNQRTVLVWMLGESPLNSGYWDGKSWRGRRLDGKEVAWEASKEWVKCWSDIERPHFDHDECKTCEYFGICHNDLQKPDYCPAKIPEK